MYERIPEFLRDIMRNAYEGKNKLEALTHFRVEVSPRKMKSKLGDYRMGRIRIFGAGSHLPEDLAIVCIHELAHHGTELLYPGSKAHGPQFYEVHERLLFTALDMGVISREDVTAAAERGMARNKQRVENLLKDYHPKRIPYKEGKWYIQAGNVYEIRGALKEKDYSYDSIAKSWGREVSREALDTEKNYIYENCPGALVLWYPACRLRLEQYETLRLEGKTQEHLMAVRESGYQYKDGYWTKTLLLKDVDREREMVEGLEGIRFC